MSDVKAWSWSRFELYELCPLWFKFRHIDKIAEAQSPAMARGDTVHKAMAKAVMNAGPVPAEVVHPFHKQLVAELQAMPNDEKVVEQQWGFTKTWKPTGWFGNDTWMRNVLDVATIYEDMTAEAIDWKTGKKYAVNQKQMELFAVAFMCKYKPVHHVTTRLVYLDVHSGVAEETAEYSRADLPAMIAKWDQRVVPMFHDEIFAPRPNEKCRFCPHSASNANRCRFG